MSAIVLSIGGLSVRLSRLLSDDCPRTRIDVVGMNYTAAGTAVGSGSLYEPKHLWDITAECTDLQMQTLKAVYITHDHFRRSLQPADVLIDDGTQLYEEFGAPTRAIVAGTEPISLPPTTLYYARFKGWFSKAPKIVQRGKYWAVNFQLMETDKS